MKTDKINFLITATGRSGTMFLSSTMNLSASWTVAHEPVDGDEHDATLAQPRFDRDFYGEVNGRLRFCFPEISTAKKGVILRDPRQVFTSAYNRHPEWFTDLGGLEQRYRDNYDCLERCLAVERVEVISFARMTTDPSYLQALVAGFGIDDLEITSEHCARVANPNSEVAAHTFDDLDRNIQDAGMRAFGWFLDKHQEFWG